MRVCERCGGERHAPTCPEMLWPDGRPRGQVAPEDMLPIPPLNPDRQIEHPGGWSPIGEEFGKMFGGLTERMIARHIRETAERLEGRDGEAGVT